MQAWLCAHTRHYINTLCVFTHSVIPCVSLPEDLLLAVWNTASELPVSQPHVRAISVHSASPCPPHSDTEEKILGSLVYDVIFWKAKVRYVIWNYIQKVCWSICRFLCVARQCIQQERISGSMCVGVWAVTGRKTNNVSGRSLGKGLMSSGRKKICLFVATPWKRKPACARNCMAWHISVRLTQSLFLVFFLSDLLKLYWSLKCAK